MKYRPGTHNGPAQCAHGRSMAQDTCPECWEFRDWKDLEDLPQMTGQLAPEMLQ